MSTSITISKQIAIKDEGVVKTSDVNSIDFTGAGVTATNVGNAVTVNIPSGGGGVTAVTATTPVVATGTTTPVISLASNYGDTQNPYASKTKNNILAAPNGTAGVPTFRAIVGADIPTLNQNTTGTADNVTGIVAVANGGTGTATPSLVAGTNVTITGTFPNQTINSSGGGGGGAGGIHVLTTPISNLVYGVRISCSSGYSSSGLPADTILLNPFIPANTLTIKNLVLNIATSAVGALIRAVIYSDLNGVPSSKLLESTDLIASTTGDKTYTVSFTFTAGTTYWLGAYSNAAVQVVVVNLDRLIPISNNNLYGGHSTLAASVTYPNAPATLGAAGPSTAPAVSINLTAL